MEDALRSASISDKGTLMLAQSNVKAGRIKSF